jgi:hypothetical protein
MNVQPVPKQHKLNQKSSFLKIVLMRLWPLAIGLVFVLFPFDWLNNVWPAYRQVFEHVFVGAREHHIGHVTLFFIIGLILLLSFPALRARPLIYIALMLTAALTQEAVQDLFKLQILDLTDGLDLLFDAIGFIIAYLVVWGCQAVSRWRRA